MGKILIYSETIFSDRLCREIISQTKKDSVKIIFSHQVVKNDLLLRRSDALPVYKIRVRVSRYIFFLLRYVAPKGVNMQALDDHFELDFISSGELRKLLSKILITLMSRFKYFRNLAQKIALFLIPTDVVDNYFNTNEKVNVICFSLANLKSISVMSLFAKFKNKKNVKSFCIIQSWDNPTTKGYGVIRPDYTFTWTELMRKEIAEYQDISEKNSFAIGSPTFAGLDTIEKKQDYVKKKQKIIFATKSPASYQNNIDIIIFLATYIKYKNIDLEVRIHPICLLRKSNEFERIKYLSEKHGFILRYPDVNDDIPNLNAKSDNLAFSSNQGDILVTVYSTMNIEAAYVGLRCINIDFELNSSTPKLSRMNMDIDRRQLHNQRMLDYGYIFNVKSLEDFIMTLDDICQQQEISGDLEESRQLMIKNECQPVFSISKLLNMIHKYDRS